MPRFRYINRVVLVNERGDRILDTLVRPTNFPEGCQVQARDGLKSKVFQLAAELGPSLETVAEVIANIVKDKPFVGYHQTNKLTDIGYWDPAIAIGDKTNKKTLKESPKSTPRETSPESPKAHNNRFKAKDVDLPIQNSLFANLFDTAKIFNKTTHSQIQLPIGQLCIDELNLTIPQRTYPFAFNEAKISMALYFRWLDIKNGNVALSIHRSLGVAGSRSKINDNKDYTKVFEKLKCQFEKKD